MVAPGPPLSLAVQMTIDTLFMCFCEDCSRNDGITKPYYMSVGLMVGTHTQLLQLFTASQTSTCSP